MAEPIAGHSKRARIDDQVLSELVDRKDQREEEIEEEAKQKDLDFIWKNGFYQKGKIYHQ